MSSSPPRTDGSWLLPTLCAVVFVSGASALVYQILWLRHLGLLFGVTVYAASTVWASFMAGLALGSFVAGRIADRLRRPLAGFAAAEAGIAISGAATMLAFSALQAWSPQLAPDPDTGFARATAIRFAVTFAILIVPTGLMGATLPLVVKSSISHARFGTAVGLLYGSNTAGAILGALVAGLWLVPVFGMRRTFIAAAALNLLAALTALLLSRSSAASASTLPAPADTSSRDSRPDVWPQRVVLATFALSGAVALAVEVVWLRSATIIAGPTVYTVAVLLAAVLAGIAFGSYAITPVLGRIKHPVLTLAALEWLIALTILLSLSFLTKTPATSALLAGWLERVLPPYLTPVVSAAVLAALPTSFLMGLAFPLGLQIWTAGSAGATHGASASRIGTFYAWNVCGGIVGSLAAGFVLLPVLGSRWSIIALGSVTLASAAALAMVAGRSWLTRAGLPLAMAALFFPLASGLEDPVSALLAQRLPGQPVIWREEGIQTTASIHSFADGRRRAMHLDGYHQAADDGASVLVHYKIGVLPLALHDNPHTALVVGLGGGATPGAMSRHSRLDIDVVELSETVVRASDFFRNVNFDLLRRPNVHLRIDDGRNFLLSAARRYDIITADTIQPVRAGSASLYSAEYFTLVRERLNDDGLALQWFAGKDAEYRLVARTFASVFPYVTMWENGSLMVGTKKPPRVTPDSFNWKLQVPELRDAFASIGIQSLDDLRQQFRAAPDDVRRWLGDGPVLSDDQPILEYFLAMPRDKEADLSGLKRDPAQVFVEQPE